MTPSQLISKALNQTPEQIKAMQQKHAVAYLSRYTLNVAEFAEVAATSPLFQKFWSTQWALRDANFVWQTNLNKLELPLDIKTLFVVLDLYMMAHDPADLIIRMSEPVAADVVKYLNTYKSELEKGGNNEH